MTQTFNAGESEFNVNPDVVKLNIDNHNMADAVPARKMFSSIPVSDAQYTRDNRGTSMAGIRALAKAAAKFNGLRKAVPKTPR